MDIYFTLTGTNHHYGQDFLEPCFELTLEKEPSNPFDQEAIAVKVNGLGTIGYVANSVHTVVGESFSAGRLYDKIGDQAHGYVYLKLPNAVLCTLDCNSLNFPLSLITEDEDINENDELSF